jgi:release factor glutamine methyltransferase
MKRTAESSGGSRFTSGFVAGAIDEGTHALRAVAGDDASLEAQVLIAHALGVERGALLARLRDPLCQTDRRRFEGLLRRRLAREPLAYIVGKREFYGLELRCTPAALIPRPESEMLVDLALEAIDKMPPGAVVCDVGTGTGAVAIAIAAHAPRARVVATDRSLAALRVAQENARQLAMTSRVAFVASDLLNGLGRFDVIVANMPYVSEREWLELDPEIRCHEPRDALVGGPSGFEVVARLLDEAPAHLREDGLLAVEIGSGHGAVSMRTARRAFPRGRIEVMRDLAGLGRILTARLETSDEA